MKELYVSRDGHSFFKWTKIFRTIKIFLKKVVVKKRYKKIVCKTHKKVNDLKFLKGSAGPFVKERKILGSC